ncbi:MAG: hypothetical protein ACKESC_01460 [Candidatus Hodgkinia cicadicola]
MIENHQRSVSELISLSASLERRRRTYVNIDALYWVILRCFNLMVLFAKTYIP